MKRILTVFGAVAMALTCLLPATWAGDHDRFPGFVYTSPEAIRDAKEVLVALKYLPKDAANAGVWDAQTREATRGFQRDHFLRPDGRLDRDTMAVLMSHKPRPKSGLPAKTP